MMMMSMIMVHSFLFDFNIVILLPYLPILLLLVTFTLGSIIAVLFVGLEFCRDNAVYNISAFSYPVLITGQTSCLLSSGVFGILRDL